MLSSFAAESSQVHEPVLVELVGSQLLHQQTSSSQTLRNNQIIPLKDLKNRYIILIPHVIDSCKPYMLLTCHSIYLILGFFHGMDPNLQILNSVQTPAKLSLAPGIIIHVRAHLSKPSRRCEPQPVEARVSRQGRQARGAQIF